MGSLDRGVKDRVLLRMAELLKERGGAIQAENARDVDRAKKDGHGAAFIDRLTLSDKVMASMVKGLHEVAALPDPVGEVVKMWRRPNGLLVGRMRIPLGVIGMIYESRPNVTADAAGLCLKSGNAVILRGGSEAITPTWPWPALCRRPWPRRASPRPRCRSSPAWTGRRRSRLLTLDELIDLIIPRGGEGLIRFVAENSRIPVMKHYKGVCHIFVDEAADLEMAETSAATPRCSAPGSATPWKPSWSTSSARQRSCPACAPLPGGRGGTAGVPRDARFCPRVKPAAEEDWGAEYLDLILAIKVVAGPRRGH